MMDIDWQSCSFIAAVIATCVLIVNLVVNSYQSKKSLDEIRKAREIEIYRNIKKDWYDLINSQMTLKYLALILKNPTIQEAKHREPFLRTEQDYENIYRQYTNEICELDEQIKVEFGVQDPLVNILNFFKDINKCIDNGWIPAERADMGGTILEYWRSLYLLVCRLSYEDHYPHYREFKSLVDRMDRVRIEQQKRGIIGEIKWKCQLYWKKRNGR